MLCRDERCFGCRAEWSISRPGERPRHTSATALPAVPTSATARCSWHGSGTRGGSRCSRHASGLDAVVRDHRRRQRRSCFGRRDAACGASGCEVIAAGAEPTQRDRSCVWSWGDAEVWQRNWPLWQRIRGEGEVLIRAEQQSDLRQLAGVRELPPYARTPRRPSLVRRGAGAPRRVVLPATVAAMSSESLGWARLGSARKRRVRQIPAPGRIAPTIEPPPETVRGSASASVATSALLRPPARSRSVAATIVDARVAPSSIFIATVVPFGGDHHHDAFGAVLGEDSEFLDRDRVGAARSFDRPRALSHRPHHEPATR